MMAKEIVDDSQPAMRKLEGIYVRESVAKEKLIRRKGTCFIYLFILFFFWLYVFPLTCVIAKEFSVMHQ